MSTTVVGVDAGLADCSALEHLLAHAQDHTGPAVLACTHLVDGRWVGSLELSDPTPGAAPLTPESPTPGTLTPGTLRAEWLSAELGAAVTVLAADGPARTAGPSAWQDGSRRAAQELRDRSAGRAVLFPGQDRLVGEVDTAAVTELSAITAVHAIAGIPTAGTRLVTRDFLRPVLQDGELVLQVRLFADDGRLVPFEVPNPVACCSVHA